MTPIFRKKDEPKEEPLEKKIYRHAKSKELGAIDDALYSNESPGPELEMEHIIPYRGRNILLFENLSCSLSVMEKYIVVPGFIIGEPKKYDPYKMMSVKRETMISLVELIKDDNTRKKIKSFLYDKGIGKGYDISFW